MKILITGGFGFIGKRFIEKFHNKYDLMVFGKKTDDSDFIQKISPKIILKYGDVVNDFSEIISTYKPDIIIHLAALTGLTKCNNDPKKAFSINVCGTFNVIESCKKNNSRLIFISSREVYGETLGDKTREEDPLRPNNVYGVTKMIAENMILNAHKKHNLNFTILRLTNVYGPEGDNYGAQIIIKNALNGSIEMLGGSQIMNFVYIDDVIDLLEKVIDEPKSTNEIFNVGSKDNLSIRQFVDMIQKRIGEFDIISRPMRENETGNFIPDLQKMKSVLNFETKTSIEDGLRKTINWYSNKNN